MDLPLALTQRIQSGRVVLFLGSGVGRAFRRPDDTTMPTGAELAARLDSKLGLNLGTTDLAKVAQIATLRRGGKADIIAAVAEEIAGFEPQQDIIALTDLSWRAIFTTNYDSGILRAYELNPHAAQNPRAVVVASDTVSVDPHLDVPVYFLHGCLGKRGSDILITEDDYALFYNSRRMLFDLLRTRFADCTFLYIGYSNSDPNWGMVQAEVRKEFGNIQLPQAFRISPDTDVIEREILTGKGIETLEGTLTEFSKALTIAGIHACHAVLPAEADIPSALRDIYKAQPGPVLRFLNSWEVCNAADFAQPSNTSLFLKGDQANWGLIDRKLAVERDLKPDIYEKLLDYITSPTPTRPVLLVLGAAGYGVSTLLMQLAHLMVKDGAATVLRLKPGAVLLEGDVLFAASELPLRPVFIVDNATTWKRKIRSCTHLLGQQGLRSAFVLGARLNEWRTALGRLKPQEFLLEPLSDPEIESLLSLLEQQNELGALRDLDREAQIAQIKIRNEKDLLVTLREVTEGRMFDSIIEDEYRRLGSDRARKLYSLVSGLYQERQMLRDMTAARVLNLNTDELFAAVAELEGIIFHEVVDQNEGIFAFRGRHRVISKVIWNVCTEGTEREKLLLDTMRSLNLTYQSDRAAFDVLYQSDPIVDSIPSVEARIDFFESASYNDPRNAFVKQHFARMFYRERMYTLALGQIDQALNDDDARSLHHTKGLILARMATAAESLEIGRRYLALAQQELTQCIAADPADDYAYQTLAELYREWAGKVPDADEATSYYRRAEETIYNGLRRTINHHFLHIESSKIADDLGRKPEQLAQLKKAVEENTASEYARYLYGRELRQRGKYEEAILILRPVFLENPAAFRTAIELAISQVGLTNNYAEGVAILRQVRAFASTDARFIATLGGMQFLARRQDDAMKTFQLGRRLSIEEQRTIHYRPTTQLGDFPRQPITFEGTVTSVNAGYIFIAVTGYGDVFCPTSRLSRRGFRMGEALRFELVFTPRGAMADIQSIQRL